MLNLYRRMLALRRSSPALQWGAYRWLDAGTEDCFAFLREANGQRMLVAFNFAEAELVVNVGGLGQGRARLSTSVDRAGDTDLSNLRLQPLEAVVVELDQ